MAIQDKLNRLRETNVNLSRVGGVGPRPEQFQHMEHVINAQSDLLYAMAEKLLNTATCGPEPKEAAAKLGDAAQKIIEGPELKIGNAAEKGRKVAAAK